MPDESVDGGLCFTAIIKRILRNVGGDNNDNVSYGFGNVSWAYKEYISVDFGHNFII